MYNAPKQGHILRFERSEAKYVPLPWFVRPCYFFFSLSVTKTLCDVGFWPSVIIFCGCVVVGSLGFGTFGGGLLSGLPLFGVDMRLSPKKLMFQ